MQFHRSCLHALAIVVFVPQLAGGALPGGGTVGPNAPIGPVESVESVESGESGEPEPRYGKDGGEPGIGYVVAVDDLPPLPVARRYVASDGGDRLVAAASGDPHFLGFAGGEYRPPAGERLDPQLGDAIVRLGSDGRRAAEIYAFVMLEKRVTPGRIAALEALGVRDLGFHPNACFKAAIPVAALMDVALHPEVRWVGVARGWQKVHPFLARRFMHEPPGGRVRGYVNVFESDLGEATVREERVGSRPLEVDPGSGPRPGNAELASYRVVSNGWQQLALEAAGVTIHEYVPEIDAFLAEFDYSQLERMIALDFVQFVEAEMPARRMHDESTPMILADRVRQFYDGGTNEVAQVGEIDSGVRVTHEALSHIYYAGWDVTASSGGVFDDNCDHGTHVLATILGKPPGSKAERTGVAPGLGYGQDGRVRIVKYLEEVGAPINDCAGLLPVQALFPLFNTPYVDGVGQTSPKSHVVNNSWGADPDTTPWIGSEYLARSYDAEIFASDVLHVCAAGNAGPGAGSIGMPGGAKNVLAVGSVIDFISTDGDPGTIAGSSSRGPCGDGRWKPNVVAPGSLIMSALGTGNASYGDKSGTSMASPHVTGVVAQLIDRHSFLRYEPARVTSLLMATATQKDDVSITSPTSTHLDQYGAGRVDAYRAVYETSQMEWTNWGFDQLPGSWQFGDFNIASGATRLVVVMHYVEAAISSGANKALLNDFDLYIDQAPVDVVNGNTGEYTAQQSSIDNTEIRIISNPAAGPWRWKTFPNFTLTPVKMSVTIHVVYGDTTPDPSFTVDVDDVYVRPGDDVTITATVSNPDFVASAVVLDATATVGMNVISSKTTLDDGIVTNLLDNPSGGVDVLLGNIRHGSSRTAEWVVDWANGGVKTFQLEARSDNALDKSATRTIYVDGSIPGTVGSLVSSSHAPNTWSNDSTIDFSWIAANDAISGVDGYAAILSTSQGAIPDPIKNISAITALTVNAASNPSGQYFKIRAVDKCENWGNHVQIGPYRIDTVKPSIASALTSTTHQAGVWSNVPTITYTWSAAPDLHSGIDGYGLSVSTSAPGLPNANKLIEEVTSFTHTLGSSASGKYLNLRAVDNAGNWSDTQASYGPILIDTFDPSVVSALASATHVVGQWSKNTNASFSWTAATDSHSGLAGYSVVVEKTASGGPDITQDIGTVTSHSATLSNSVDPYYFKIRSIDLAGNADAQHAQLGPILIDTVGPSAPGNVKSPSHGSAWSNDPNVTVEWQPATDAQSGVAGYRFTMSTAIAPSPTGPLTLPASATSVTGPLTTGTWYFGMEAEDEAGNEGGPAFIVTPFRIDLVAPGAISNLASPSHVLGQADIDPVVTVTWNAASDAHSGIGGYLVSFDKFSSTEPTGPANVPAGTTQFTQTLSSGKWFAHVRAVDVAGNLGPTAHLGTFNVLACVPASNATYGTGKPGTNGVPTLTALSPPVLGESSTVLLGNALPGALPILFLGVSAASIPFDGGLLLNGATWIIPIPVPVFPDGTLPLIGTLPLDPALCGFSLYHQVMFADPAAGGYYQLAQTAGLRRTFGY
jgi:hypothetical protein